MIDSIAAHLWQSTFFGVAVALLTLAFRRNRARVRFWLWLTASLKFFIPFALLMSVGAQLAQKLTWESAPPAVSIAVEYVAMPFVASSFPAPAAPPRRNWALFALIGVWLCGVLTVIAIRARMWFRIRALLRASTPIEIPSAVEVRSAPGLLEPGVVGGIAWLRPILLLPEGIFETLTPSQLEAVLAHELCHVRRRDNLFAALQMIAEAVFWFHPLVWWIGARLVDERERACDEDVLTLGNEPRVYADAILNVCKLYAESPLVCVAGVTGSDIRARIEAIMTNRIGVTLNSAKKLLLATAGFAAIAGPIAIGLLIGIGHLPAINAQSLPAVIAPIAQLAQSVTQSESPAPRSALDNPVQLAQAVPGGRGPAASPQSNSPTDSGIIRYRDHQLVAMFFDLDGTTADEQSRARSAAEGFVQNSLQPADLVAVMTNTGGSVQVMQDFTADTTVLHAIIQKMSAVSNSSETADDRLAHLVTLTKMLAGFPERKTLMYYSSATVGASQTELQNALNALTLANVAIFPISVNAVVPAPVDPSAVPKPMARIYQRYGAPSQIEDRGTSTIWRYSYLEDFHGNAAFEYSNNGGPGVRIAYPPPTATFQGKAADAAQLAALANQLNAEQHGAIQAQPAVTPFSGRNASIGIYPVAPGTAPAADRYFVPVVVPLDAFSGQVDIFAQVKTPPDAGTPNKILAAMRDQANASAGTFQAGFTLPPGNYACYVLVRELSTGRTFGEEIDFNIQ